MRYISDDLTNKLLCKDLIKTEIKRIKATVLAKKGILIKIENIVINYVIF